MAVQMRVLKGPDQYLEASMHRVEEKDGVWSLVVRIVLYLLAERLKLTFPIMHLTFFLCILIKHNLHKCLLEDSFTSLHMPQTSSGKINLFILPF